MLTYLKNKSEFNIDGAKLLIDNDLFAPSIHCSYYSVFQSMIYVYCSKKNMTLREYTHEVKESKSSSHEYLIASFCSLVVDKRDKSSLKRKIKDLKTSRIKSDYNDFQVDSEFSKKALIKAKELLSEIKNI